MGEACKFGDALYDWDVWFVRVGVDGWEDAFYLRVAWSAL